MPYYLSSFLKSPKIDLRLKINYKNKKWFRPMVKLVDACLDWKKKEKRKLYYFPILFLSLFPSLNLISESISTANYLFYILYLKLELNNFVSVINLITFAMWVTLSLLITGRFYCFHVTLFSSHFFIKEVKKWCYSLYIKIHFNERLTNFCMSKHAF